MDADMPYRNLDAEGHALSLESYRGGSRADGSRVRDRMGRGGGNGSGKGAEFLDWPLAQSRRIETI